MADAEEKKEDADGAEETPAKSSPLPWILVTVLCGGPLPVRPYGLIGVSYIETTANFPGGGSDGENYKDLSLGLGADITITNQIFLSVEYLRAVDRSSDEVSNLGFGINGRF